MKNLTPSEFEVLKLITKGYKTKDIASARCVSTHTVKTQTKSIFQKLQVRNRAEAAITLTRLTMLAPDKGLAVVVKDNLGSAPCG